MAGRPATHTILALDTGSPVVSVALAAGTEVLAERTVPQMQSSRHLLRMVDEVLKECGLELADLGGLIALGGPGSFTGLRVGLATALGLHQASGLPATALPTLPLLAHAAPPEVTLGDAPRVAAVDALRGEWFVQSFNGWPAQPLGEPQRLPAEQLASFGAGPVIGFGCGQLAQIPGWPPERALLEPPPLAAIAACHAAGMPEPWSAASLSAPLYLRLPAITRPAAPASA